MEKGIQNKKINNCLNKFKKTLEQYNSLDHSQLSLSIPDTMNNSFNNVKQSSVFDTQHPYNTRAL